MDQSDRDEEPHDTCLIPENIVDPASQRIFLVSIFVVIQCWKIYDILLVKADAFALADASKVDAVAETAFTSLNNFTFVIKYVVVDGLFLWCLPMLNVPLLSFRPLVTLLLTALVNAFTFVLASNTALPLLSGVVVPVWNSVFRHRELTIVGDSVTPLSVIDMNAHFKGKYTIHYLPASSVTLNPFSYENLCLDSGDSQFLPVVRLPIEFNTTSDIALLQIQHIAPSNAITLLNFTASDVARLMRKDYTHLHSASGYVANDERVFYVEIDIRKPGKYRIHKVTDSSGMSIRPVKSDFSIGTCPHAKLVYPGLELAYTETRCVSSGKEPDWHLPLLSVAGVMPMDVEIVALLNGKPVSRFNASLAGETQKVGLGWLDAQEVTRNTLEQEVLHHPQMFQTGGGGKFEFRVAKVTDKMGILREYNPASTDKEIYFAADLRESVKLRLVDRHPDDPLLFGRAKTLHFDTKQRVELPLTVTVQFLEGNSRKNSTYVISDAEEFYRGILLNEPGTYAIVAAKDKFCLCELDQTELVKIVTPQPPTAAIAGESISDKCVGTVGLQFDLNFTGRSPFELQYEIFKNLSGILKPVLSERGLRQHLKRAMESKLRFQYRPRQEGNYVVVFKLLKDSNYYKSPVQLDEAENTFSAYFHRKSKYTFFKNKQQTHQNIDVCKGGAVVAPVYFEGNFPFLFKYEIRDVNTGSVVLSQKVSNYYQDSYTISSPNFNNGGTFKITVKDVIDKLGCPVGSPNDEWITVNARTDVPSAKFQKSEKFTIVEGDSVTVPITISSSIGSNSGDKIVYSYRESRDSKTSKHFSLVGSNKLKVSKAGVYQLVSFESKGCSGTVSDTTIEVLHYARPSLAVVPVEGTVSKSDDKLIRLNPICQNSPRNLHLKLEGHGPFVVAYQIRYPSGSIKTSSMEIEKNEITIPLTLKRNGLYEHMFTAVYDSRYTQEKMRHIQHNFNFPSVLYEVQSSPSLQIDKAYLQFCEAQVSEKFSAPVPITLEGKYPFTLSGHIRKVNGDVLDKFLVEVTAASVDIGALQLKTPLLSLLTVGEYSVTFDTIKDANQCQLQLLGPQHTVRVSITQIPTIQKQNAKDYYCVGDHIAYNMSGISPFTLFYKFDGQMRRTEQGHEFVRLASKPGELAIVALKDSSASLCLVNFTNNEAEYNKLKLEVRQLPSVEISHGDSIIKNLHEGDQTEVTFKFSGVPPFLVTYVRTLGDDEGQSKRRKTTKRSSKLARRVVEQKTIKDIWDYEYSEVVGLEGTYEAIMVADAYCRATRDVSEIL